MKSISAALSAHLAGEVRTLATLWKVTLTNGTVLAFTDHDEDIEFGGRTYFSSSGYTPSDIASTNTLQVDNLDLQGMLVSPSITEVDLRAGLWDNAQIRISIVNWANLTMGELVQRVGHLGEVTLERGQFHAELRGLTQAYSTTIVELTSAMCRATLGDSRCNVNLTGSPSFTVTGTVASIDSDNVTLHDASRTEAPHPSGFAYFIGGKLTWLTGNNAGLSMEIREATTGVLQLGLPMPYEVQPGDTYSLTAGCSKHLEDCVGTFDNVLNFRGEPHLRGNDALIQQGRHD